LLNPRDRPAALRAISAPALPGVAIFVAAVLVCVELWAASTHAVTIARTGYRSLVAPGYSVEAGDLDPLAYFASTQALVQARQAIPRDATYAVVVGDEFSPSTRTAVGLAFRFWLLPRRYTTDRKHAQWVIAYHHPSETLGVKYVKEIGLAPDVNLVEVRR
jgi:hypothetical protein